MTRWTVGTGLFLAAVAGAFAQDASVSKVRLQATYYACIKAARGVTVALNDCIGAEHAYQDQRLNAAYQKLRRTLPVGPGTSLRDEERAWILNRDKTCAPDKSGGTASLLDANQCQLDQTAARAAVLEDRAK